MRRRVPVVKPDILPGELERLKSLLDSSRWIFAKTMPQNPHEYTLRKEWRVDADFEWAVAFIRAQGYRSKYGGSWYTQMDVGNHFYWTMGFPINRKDGTPYTILINRKLLAKTDVSMAAGSVLIEPVRGADITTDENHGQALLSFSEFKAATSSPTQD